MKKIGKITCETHADTGYDFHNNGSFNGSTDDKEEALTIIAACRLFDSLIPRKGLKRSGEEGLAGDCCSGEWCYFGSPGVLWKILSVGYEEVFIGRLDGAGQLQFNAVAVGTCCYDCD